MIETDSLLNEAIQEYVDELLTKEDPQKNALLSPQAKRVALEEKVRSDVNFIGLGNLISSALNSAYNEGTRYLSLENYEALLESLDLLSEHLEDLGLHFENFNEKALMQALMISDIAEQNILQIAIEKTKEGLLEESLALHFFLTLSNPNEADYWLRLGLIAEKSEKYELASKAFSTVSRLLPDFIGSRIFAAGCYLLRNMPDLAKEQFHEAEEMSKKLKVKGEWQNELAALKTALQ